MGNTITPLPISSIGDSYNGLLPNDLSTYSDTLPVFSGPAYNVTSSAASPSDANTFDWQGLSNLFNSVGTTVGSILKATSGPTVTPQTGSQVAQTAQKSSSSIWGLLLIALLVGIALFAIHEAK